MLINGIRLPIPNRTCSQFKILLNFQIMEFIGIGEAAESQYSVLRKELDSLLAQRTSYEVEADAIHSELTSPGLNGEPPAGIKDPLVDDEGFPRGDIDIYNVRQKRHRLAEINYEYKQLMKRIEDLTKTLFSIPRPDTSETTNNTVSEPPPHHNIAGNVITLPAALGPMAILDEVLLDSPAHTAGVRNGDRLLQFGYITHATSNFMQCIAKLVGESVQQSISIVVERRYLSSEAGTSAAETSESNVYRNEILQLTLVPRPWSGRGLLGCHLSPIK